MGRPGRCSTFLAAVALGSEGVEALISPAQDGAPSVTPTGTVTFFDGNGVATVAIAPGDFFTYTIDPRAAGRLVDPKTGLRHVPVHFEFATEVAVGVVN